MTLDRSAKEDEPSTESISRPRKGENGAPKDRGGGILTCNRVHIHSLTYKPQD